MTSSDWWPLAAEITFWVSTAAVGFAYLGYPAVVYALSRVFGRARQPIGDREGAAGSSCTPTVSLLIAAHNEEKVIAEKLTNALATDYSPDLLEIVVASDGSADRTNDLVRAAAMTRVPGTPGVRLLDYHDRRGKSAALNRSVPQLQGEIVVFSDANTMFEPDAVSKLVRWFADPSVSTVCGRLVLVDPAGGGNVDSLYWRYETFLKKCEARLDALLGANGAIYAMRRSRYASIPDGTIVDDFVIPLLSKLRFGGRIVYDAEAVAFEEAPPEIGDEFRRRSRIGAGAYQSLPLLWQLALPRHGWTPFTFLMHKVLRWAVPFFLVAMLVMSIALAGKPLYLMLVVFQLGFYALSLAAVGSEGRTLPWRLVRAASMFTGMNLALLVGFFRWLFVTPKGTWQRTTR